jgi:hypothetical protein
MKNTKPFIDHLVELIRDPDDWEWHEQFITDKARQLTVYDDGKISIGGIGVLPLDYVETRRITRAYAATHKRLTAKLVDVGQQALRQGLLKS